MAVTTSVMTATTHYDRDGRYDRYDRYNRGPDVSVRYQYDDRAIAAAVTTTAAAMTARPARSWAPLPAA